ncbi:MAG: hypothetical protein IPI77_23530 [Saprospiraceae bacterium]|nr:hypothetical protein [Saprospiraceae bacterium]
MLWQDVTQLYEFSFQRIQSSMYGPISIGVGTDLDIDSVKAIWPDHQYQMYYNIPVADHDHAGTQRCYTGLDGYSFPSVALFSPHPVLN